MIIVTSINPGSIGGPIARLQELEAKYAKSKIGIINATGLAAKKTSLDIKENLKARGNPFKFLDVTVQKSGEFGQLVKIAPKAGLTEGQLIAANIFLGSESGHFGRQEYQVASKPNCSEMIASHDSTWSKVKAGDRVGWKATIPMLGAFYWSGKNGVEQIPIKQFAKEKMISNLNERYQKLFKD